MRILLLTCVLSACGASLFDDDLYQEALDPALCGRQLMIMRRFEFDDASFRAPEGLLVGDLASLGNYHRCLAINQDFSDTNIQGKYCLIQAPMTPPTVRIPSLTSVSVSENVTWMEMTLSEDQVQKYAGKSLSLAVCVPRSCSVAAVLARYTEHPVVRFNYTEQYCRLPDDKPFVAADYVATIIFSLLAILTLISTAYELLHIFVVRSDPEETSELFRVCSLYTNTRRLLTFEKPRPLDCLDGIRSLSTLWIIIFHTFFVHFMTAKYTVNSFEIFQWQFKKQALWNVSSSLAVDSFFTLSGLLLIYTRVNKMKPMSLLSNLHMFYLNRYLRLFPLLATAVLLQASVMHRVSDGPDWHTVADEVHLCRRYWWSALLHVQNIVNAQEMCLLQTWYLSVDMQLYVLSPLVLYWVLGSRRAACAALALAILASFATNLAFCFIYDFPILLSAHRASMPSLDEAYNYWVFYYLNTLVRSPSFFIGMLFGYILHIVRDQQIKLSQRTVFTCHILALGILIYAIYIVHPSMQVDWVNQFTDNMSNSLRRPCWSLALCWVIFACVHGYGGPVNWFLTLRLWKFVARISYAMYLFHYLVQKTNAGTTVSSVYFNMETLFSLFASDLLYTVVLSTAACVLVEEPALTLQRILLRGAFKPQQKENEDGNTPASNS